MPLFLWDSGIFQLKTFLTIKRIIKMMVTMMAPTMTNSMNIDFKENSTRGRKVYRLISVGLISILFGYLWLPI